MREESGKLDAIANRKEDFMISEDDYYHERPSYELPVPDLEPQPITSNDYMNYTPEQLELVSSFLVSKAEDNYWRVGEARRRHRLLSVLLKNQGLLKVVQMAPKALWEQALFQVYGNSDEL
jgi:hypothetical protein